MMHHSSLPIPLLLKRLPNGAEFDLPVYASDGAAGFDLRAALYATDDDDMGPLYLNPGDRALVPTGIAVAVPEGYELQIRPRSGAALKQGLAVLNSPGTVDSDYRGEVKVLLYNSGNEWVEIEHGDRIAQAVLCPVFRAKFEVVPELPETRRGDGGFGSSGTR